MLRKKLTPSVLRRCAIFLAMGGALALNGARAQGGLALPWSSDDQGTTTASKTLAGPEQSPSKLRISTMVAGTGAGAVSVKSITDSPAWGGPGLTGENWLQGLQTDVDHAFVNQDDLSPKTAPSHKDAVDEPDPGVKANAIPSLPSFWSGLTCCIALMIVGMFPRVRRVLR